MAAAALLPLFKSVLLRTTTTTTTATAAAANNSGGDTRGECPFHIRAESEAFFTFPSLGVGLQIP